MLKNLSAILMATAALTTPIFSHRDIGSEIYAFQSRLAALGFFNIKVTGMYGTLTETAYTLYQEANGFAITGIPTGDEINHLYSLRAKPLLDSTRRIPASTYLSSDSFSAIEQRATPEIELQLVSVNKTATFKFTRSQGHFIGELTDIDTSKLNAQLRYPVIATIQGVNYPASMDFSGSEAHLHFKDSLSYLGLPDSEHQYNIGKLLGL